MLFDFLVLLKRLRTNFSAESVAAAMYLLVYPLFLLVDFRYFPLWERFAYRWQCICLLVAFSFFILGLSSRASSRLFQYLLVHKYFIGIFGFFLFGGFLKSFFGADFNVDGFLSMALFLIAAPLMGYLATSGAVQKMPLVFSLLSCLLVVLLEIVFSVLYAFKGLSMNDSFAISMANLPRFFLNTRDFDFFVLVLAVLAINFVSERYLRRGVFILDAPFLISSVALAMSILVGFLNGGRGLLMCLVFSVSLSLIRLGSSLSRFLLMFWSAACLALSSLLLRIIRVSLDIALSNTFNGFLSLARDGSGGRLSLWGQWLSSVKTFEDFVFGNGLSLPSGIVVAVDSFPSNPHNLLIEFFVKGGFVLVAIILIFVARYMRILFVKNQRLFASLSLLIAPILLYSLIAAPFEWPSGLWVIGLAVFGVGFYEGGCLNILGARSCLFSRLVPSLAQVYVLAVAFVFSVLSVRFLFVKQIELIPGILLK